MPTWGVAPTGVKSSLTRVSTPERNKRTLPFSQGRVNPVATAMFIGPAAAKVFDHEGALNAVEAERGKPSGRFSGM